MSPKVRLDVLLVERGLAESRQQAQRLILSGKVSGESLLYDKPGLQVESDCVLNVRAPEHPYVSRGGIKLAAALDAWRIEPSGWVCADLGSSTGGFTDCLLQRGAGKVYAFDVGVGQLHWRLRQDARVKVCEGVNVRYLDANALEEPAELVCMDLSFISLAKALPAAGRILATSGVIIALVKPQFEVGKGKVGRGGVIRRKEDRLAVLHQHLLDARESQLAVVDLLLSPIAGAEGNREYLSLIVPDVHLTAWREKLGLPQEDYPSAARLQCLAEAEDAPDEKRISE